MRVDDLASPGDCEVGELEQLGRQVPAELDPDGEPRRQPGIGGEECLHLPLVPSQDDHQPVAVVLGPLEQSLDRFVAEPVVLAVALVDEAVGLVDEQDTAECRVDQLVGLDRGRAEVLPDQVTALRLDHRRHVEQPERVEDLGDDPGDRRLAGAWRAEEDEVLHRLLGADAHHGAAPGGFDRGRDGPHLVLDRRQADHLVQFGHRLVDGDHRLFDHRVGLRADLRRGSRRGPGAPGRHHPGAFRAGRRMAARRPRSRPLASLARLARSLARQSAGRAVAVLAPRLAAVPGDARSGTAAAYLLHLDALTAVLPGLGEPPAEYDGREQPRQGGPEQRVTLADQPERGDSRQQRDQQHPGDGSARREPPAKRARVGYQSRDHRHSEQRVVLRGTAVHLRGDQDHAP